MEKEKKLNPEEKVVIAKFADENLGGKENV
jgi:hypothetical protein